MNNLVKFETAVLAREQGFKEITRYGQDASLFDKEGKHVMYANYGMMGSGLSDGYIGAPTQEELHKWIRDNRGVLIQVYNSASGYLWALSKVPGGTDLGWSEFSGNHKDSGCFITYEDAYEDVLALVLHSSLDEFRNNEEYGKHWSNYSFYLRKIYKNN